MACRNADKAAAARAGVAAVATGPEPEVVPLDLADLESVAACAERLAGELEHLDVLMNNAGVMAVPLARTAQGFEMQLGTNHLGHFALTGRLLPLLANAPAPRVITTSSFGHKPGRIRWDDPNWHKRYMAWPAYFQTKLANLLFTLELDRRAGEAGSNLLAAAAHPGYAATNLNAAGPGSSNAVMLGATKVLDRALGQPDHMGALPQLYAATMPDVAGNDYWGPDGLLEQRGHPKRVGRTKRASNGDDARRLWAMSEELTGVSYAWG
jgi:NAD(P)-dependent dehydrogenase (short-subunit alcohol dehydrogenase family)